MSIDVFANLSIRILLVGSLVGFSTSLRDASGQVSSGLIGAKVTQKRGVVCVSDDFVVYRVAHDKGADHCWKLDYERAVGVVEKIEKGGFAVVRFETNRGWDRYVVNDRAVVRDYWNEELYIAHKAESAMFRPNENGLLLTGEDGSQQLNLPIRVRFPLGCVSFPPPRFGDRVVRGPDWNKGAADGEPGLEGTIIQRSPVDPSPRGRDGYVTVQWDATRRKGRYRWDYHRKFDVIPANVQPPTVGNDVTPPSETAGDSGNPQPAAATDGPPLSSSGNDPT
jgi:hypothetical protein